MLCNSHGGTTARQVRSVYQFENLDQDLKTMQGTHLHRVVPPLQSDSLIIIMGSKISLASHIFPMKAVLSP